MESERVHVKCTIKEPYSGNFGLDMKHHRDNASRDISADCNSVI